MTNYNTRKQNFQGNTKYFVNPSELNIRFKGFSYTNGYIKDNTYYLKYKSVKKNVYCKKCDKRCDRNKGYNYVYPLIASYNNKQVLCEFKKLKMYCSKCKTQTTQPTPSVSVKFQISRNVLNSAMEDLSVMNSTYTQVARSKFMSISTVIRSFDDMQVSKIDYTKYSIIGIDEIRFIKSAGNYQCTIFDATSGLIIEILKNREINTVKAFLKENFSHVEILSQDLWITYKNAGLYANPNVKIVADLFHVVRTSMWAFNRGRISHFEKNGNKSKLRWRTYSYSIRKLDAIGKAITKYKINKDPFMKVNHQAKEMFLKVCSSSTKEEFNRIYDSFKRYTDKYNLAEYKQVIKMVKNWEPEIINAIECEVSNGIAERRNSDFKQSKRNARGFKNLKRAAKLVMYRVNIKIAPELYNFG